MACRRYGGEKSACVLEVHDMCCCGVSFSCASKVDVVFVGLCICATNMWMRRSLFAPTSMLEVVMVPACDREATVFVSSAFDVESCCMSQSFWVLQSWKSRSRLAQRTQHGGLTNPLLGPERFSLPLGLDSFASLQNETSDPLQLGQHREPPCADCPRV